MNTGHAHRVGRRLAQLLRLLAVCGAILCLITCSHGLPRLATAQEESFNAAFQEKLATRGTIILKDATLSEWIFAIQQEWNVNIVVSSDNDRGGISGAFPDETLDNVLTAILAAQGYGYRIVGNSLIVVPNEELTIKPGQKTAIFQLRTLDPASIERSVSLMLSPDGQVQSIEGTQNLMVIDSPEHLDRVQRFLDELEPPETTPTSQQGDEPAEDSERIYDRYVRTFDPQFISAEGLAEVMQTTLEEASVSFMEDENTIVVSADSEAVIGAAAKLLQTLDRPRPQVRITALLYDVNTEVLESLGWNWQHNGKGGAFATPGRSGVTGTLDSSTFNAGAAPSTEGTGGSGEAAGTVAQVTGALLTLNQASRHFDIEAILQALNTHDGARLLARPAVVASDRTEAVFEAVSEIPVQQLTQTAEGGSIGTTEFREAGITLTVTPRIMNDGSIVLDVSPVFSVLAGFEAGQPIIDRRQATTTLQITDGETVVIGGMRRRNELETQTGIPGLRDLKYVGRFFRHHSTTVTESELLVFIKAEILSVSEAGLEDEVITGRVVNDLLDAIPPATHGPIVPHCNDPYCPLHNQYPLWNHPAHGHWPPGMIINESEVPPDMQQHHAPPAYDALPNPGVPGPPLTEPAPADKPIESLPTPGAELNDFEIPPVTVEETTYRLDRLQLSVMRLPTVASEPVSAPVILPGQATIRALPPVEVPTSTIARPASVGTQPRTTISADPTPPARETADPERRRNWFRALFGQ